MFKWTPCTASSHDHQTVWRSTIESVVKPTPFQQPLGIFVTKLKSRTSHFLPQKLCCALVVAPLPGLCKTLAFILSDPSASKFPSIYLSNSLTFSGYPPLTPHHTHLMSNVKGVKKELFQHNEMPSHSPLPFWPCSEQILAVKPGMSTAE